MVDCLINLRLNDFRDVSPGGGQRHYGFVGFIRDSAHFDAVDHRIGGFESIDGSYDVSLGDFNFEELIRPADYLI